jgi:O-antigen/teichoic acid export membrane protein
MSSSPQPAPAPRRQLAGGALVSVAAQVAMLVSNAILSIAIARVLGPGGTGRYGVAATLFALLAPLATIGLRAGLLYFVSRGEWPPGQALKESQAASLALGAVAAVITVPVYVLWPDGPLQGLGGDVLALTLIAVTLWLAWTLGSSVLLARERYEAYGGAFVVQAAAGLVSGIALMFPFGVVGAVAGLAISQLAATIFAAACVLSLPGARDEARVPIRRSNLRRAAAFGSKTWLGEIFWALNFRLDVVILNIYVASSTVGVYFVAGSLGAIAWILPSALQAVVLPRVAALEAAAERTEGGLVGSDATIARSMRHGVLLAAPTALGLCLLLAVGVPLLYGPKFHDAVLYGFLLLPGVLAGGVGKVAAGGLTGRGRPGLTLIPMLAVTPPTVLAYVLVIPGSGATGAAIVSTISYTASTAVAVVLLLRLTRIPVRELLVPRRSDLRDYLAMLAGLRLYARDRIDRKGIS